MDELRRLEILRKYEILDTPNDYAFDAITELTASLLHAPIAYLSLVDSDRVWLKSVHGFDTRELPKEEGLCCTAYASGDLYVVENTLENAHTKNHSLVTGEAGIRFYAAVPLIVRGGYPLGNLCIADQQPRFMPEAEKALLKKMARLIVNQLEMHFSVRNSVRAEMSVANSLQAVLDNTSDNIVLLKPDFSVLCINDAMKKTLSCFVQKDIKLGDDFRTYVADNLLGIFNDAFGQAIRGASVSIEHLTESGEISRWFSYSVKPVYDQGGVLVGVSLTARDIDETKRNEIATKRNANTLQAILDNTSDSIILMDVDYKVLSINKVAQERNLSLRGDIVKVGDDHRHFIEPQNQELFYRGFEKAVAGIKTEIEHHTRSKIGSGWFRYKMAPVYDDDQLLMGVALTIADIDQSKRFELALQQSEEKFRKIVESAANPILIVDQQMNIVLVNPEGEKTFGYTPRELTNQKIEVLIPERLRPFSVGFLKKYIKNPKPIRMGLNRLMPALKKNGEEIQIETSLNTFELDNQVFMLIILQDVTDRILSEKKIKNQVERLKAIAWQQSHEVRQPIVNILGFVDLIKCENDKGCNETYLDLLKESTEELDRVIHKIVEYTSETKTGGRRLA